MTSQEARQQLNVCESQITCTYSNLRDVARSMGSSVVKAASRKTTMSTLMPLIISLFGLILCITSHPVWGMLLIIVGAITAYNKRQSAKLVQTAIENQQKTLNSIIDNNAEI